MKRGISGLFISGFALLGAPLWAQSATLAPVERAYQDVDFPTTHDLAQRALQAGGATREETTRLYVLLGISSATLGDAVEAKQAFVAALAIDPTLKLEKSLSPKIRDPYLEAQGYWSASPQRLSLNAKPGSDNDHLVVRVDDPASLVARVELRLGDVGATDKTTFVLTSAPITRFALPAKLSHHDYEFALRALDRYGNVLAEYGMDADPIVVRRPAPMLITPPGLAAPSRERSYILPAVLGVAGLGAAAAGVAFNLEREQAAREWNGPSCEHPGRTRLAQCQSVSSRIHRDEALTVGVYAGAGALLVSSVIALAAGGPAHPEHSAAAEFGCTVSGPSVSCSGRF
jgi:hypothetical protein